MIPRDKISNFGSVRNELAVLLFSPVRRTEHSGIDSENGGKNFDETGVGQEQADQHAKNANQNVQNLLSASVAHVTIVRCKFPEKCTAHQRRQNEGLDRQRQTRNQINDAL